MDILKRWLKLKKAQRVRNPWALASALNAGKAKGRGNTGTSKTSYFQGINRNDWNSPDGVEAAAERSAEYHGMSPKRKKGFKYSTGKKKNNNKAVSAAERKGRSRKNSKNIDQRDKNTHQQISVVESDSEEKKNQTEETRAESTQADSTPKTEGVFSDIKTDKVDKDNVIEINKKIQAEIEAIAKKDRERPKTPAKIKQKSSDVIKLRAPADKLGEQVTDINLMPTEEKIKTFKTDIDKLKTAAEKYESDFPVKKSSSSRRLLNILKETVTVDNDQLEKDFTSALYQAMKKHKEDFGVPTGNNEILKGVKNKQKPKKVEKILPLLIPAAVGARMIMGSNKTSQEKNRVKKAKDVKKIMDLPNFTKVKNAPQVKKGITDSLLAMLAGYKLTPKVNPGEMTPAQQRQWERTLQNQMRRKNIDIDKAAFKQLQNFYKDKSDTYTRRKPAKNGVKVEKILTSPPFQGAEFDPVSHRWKKPGEVAAQTGNVNVGTGGKRRVRGAGTGAAQRSVGGHARGIRRAERLGVAARGKAKGKSSTAKRSARIKAFKKLTRKR